MFSEQLVLFGEKTVFSNAQLYLRNTCTTFSVSMLSHIRYGVYVGFALSNAQCFEVFGFSCCVVFNARFGGCPRFLGLEKQKEQHGR